MNRTAIGRRIEEEAVALLEGCGYRIVERNFRTRRAEIDVIAWKDDTLCFVEVRSRTGRSHGGAVESITRTKLGRLRHGALAYLRRFRGNPPPCRFDLLAVDLAPDDARILEWEIVENILVATL